MKRIFDARVRHELLDISTRTFANEIQPGTSLNQRAFGEAVRLLGAFTLGGGDGRRPTDIDALRRGPRREMKPGEEAGGHVRCDRQTEQQVIEHTTLPLAAGGLNHDADDFTTRNSRAPGRRDPIPSCAVRRCVRCRAPIDAQVWQCATCGWQAERRDGVTILVRDAGELSQGFSTEQFENLLTVESCHFWFAARNKLITWALRRFFPGARTFLEVGCGTGQVLRALDQAMPSLRMTGLEASFAGLRFMLERVPRLQAVQAVATALPYESEFDVVGAFDLLEHIPDDAAAIAEIVRSVKPGGGVLLTVPQHPRLWSAVDRYSGHQRRYTRRGLTSLVRTSGLDLLFATSFVSLLLPALLLSRMRQQNETVDPLQEFRIPPAVNAFGRTMMAVERRLIRYGVSLPAGGSLLVVARRPVGDPSRY